MPFTVLTFDEGSFSAPAGRLATAFFDEDARPEAFALAAKWPALNERSRRTAAIKPAKRLVVGIPCEAIVE